MLDEDPDPGARSDEALIAATAAGDRAAFGTLVERYQRPVLHLARAIVRNPQEAEDVLQDTFLGALRGAGTYRGDAPVSAWLFAIARHAAFRIGRRAAEVATDEPSLEQLGAEAGWGQPDVELAAERAEGHARLAAALATLAADEREVLMLRDGADMSGPDTAVALGVSVAAMKSRLHRARLKLAGALRRQGGDHGDR